MPREIEELHERGIDRIFSPDDGRDDGPAGHDQRGRRGLRLRPLGAGASAAERRPDLPLARAASPVAEAWRDRRGSRRRAPEDGTRRAARWSGSPGPAARARAASPTSSCAASCSDFPDKRVAVLLRRSDAAPDRRRAPRRPHSLQQPAEPAGVPALARPRAGAAAEMSGRRSATCSTLVKRQRLRPDLRRDRRHRPGRQRDHASSRDLCALRDDQRVRRAEPAREDRDAGLRRLRGDQQVHPARQRGRPARCAQAGTSATTSCSIADPETLPVFGTSAAHFNDTGVNALYAHLVEQAEPRRSTLGWESQLPGRRARGSPTRASTSSRRAASAI